MDYHANAREMGQSQDTDYDGLHSPKLNQVSGSYPHRRMALYVAPFALSLPSFIPTNAYGSLLPYATGQNCISPISRGLSGEQSSVS
ncbi:MAG: hypothetical protein RL326_987 [Pseudomonadota bacterium]|jgi:hypothetical protein